jgi:transcriptional regulator with XRE-family HTH domain
MTFGEKVKKLRLILGLSQSQFGELMHVNFTTINRWERGRNNPNYEAVLLFEQLCKEHHIVFETNKGTE